MPQDKLADFVETEKIARFGTLLEKETDRHKRATLTRLLADEEAKRAARIEAARKQTKPDTSWGLPEVILCDRDADAFEQAAKLIGGSDYGIQLWHLARLVIRLPSHGPERAAT